MYGTILHSGIMARGTGQVLWQLNTQSIAYTYIVALLNIYTYVHVMVMKGNVLIICISAQHDSQIPVVT